MIRQLKTLIWSALVAIALVPAATAATDGPPRPYFGTESGTNVLQDFSFPYLTIAIEADGVASQVGRYSGQGVVVIDVTTGDVVLSQYTSTARNGDQLYADLNSIPIDEFTLLVEGTITGGTGRFANASGEYLFLLRYDYPSDVLPNSYDAVFSGWMSR